MDWLRSLTFNYAAPIRRNSLFGPTLAVNFPSELKFMRVNNLHFKVISVKKTEYFTVAHTHRGHILSFHMPPMADTD